MRAVVAVRLETAVTVDMASGREGLRPPNEEQVTVRPAVVVAMDAPSVSVRRFRPGSAHNKAPSGLEPLYEALQASA